MAEPPTPVPSISPAEMQILVSRTGLVLNPGQVADLVLAWRQVAALIGSIPHDRPLIDDLATTFRLPPPPAPASDKADEATRKPTHPAVPTPRPPAKQANATAKQRARPGSGMAAAKSGTTKPPARAASAKPSAAGPSAPKQAPRQR
jgi:hypothetical protein